MTNFQKAVDSRLGYKPIRVETPFHCYFEGVENSRTLDTFIHLFDLSLRLRFDGEKLLVMDVKGAREWVELGINKTEIERTSYNRLTKKLKKSLTSKLELSSTKMYKYHLSFNQYLSEIKKEIKHTEPYPDMLVIKEVAIA